MIKRAFSALVWDDFGDERDSEEEAKEGNANDASDDDGDDSDEECAGFDNASLQRPPPSETQSRSAATLVRKRESEQDSSSAPSDRKKKKKRKRSSGTTLSRGWLPESVCRLADPRLSGVDGEPDWRQVGEDEAEEGDQDVSLDPEEEEEEQDDDDDGDAAFSSQMAVPKKFRGKHFCRLCPEKIIINDDDLEVHLQSKVRKGEKERNKK